MHVSLLTKFLAERVIFSFNLSLFRFQHNSMPVFFFIDPEIVNDGQLARVNNITLSYTFFQTDLDDDDDDDEDDDEIDGNDGGAEKGGQDGAADTTATDNRRGGSERSWTKKLAFWRK